jgi:hypothetical protein
MAGGGLPSEPPPEPPPEPRENARPDDGVPPDENADPPARTELSEQQRRRLAEVFGEVLPATTSDERDDREDAAGRNADARFLADRPPHHDREQ